MLMGFLCSRSAPMAPAGASGTICSASIKPRLVTGKASTFPVAAVESFQSIAFSKTVEGKPSIDQKPVC